jgi:hypothetical protein
LGLAAVRDDNTHETVNLESRQMKTSKWITAALVALALAAITIGVGGCKEKEPGQGQSQTGTSTNLVQYTCGMHPEVVQDNPGKCPKCGMDLVEKK